MLVTDLARLLELGCPFLGVILGKSKAVAPWGAQEKTFIVLREGGSDCNT